jgi:hypothetical protein
MLIHLYWCLTNWEIWGALGQWVGAISTTCAVVVALWLATAAARPRIRAHLHLDQDADVVYLVAVNDGPRTITLVHAGLRIPSSRWETVITETATARLPKRLAESEFVYLRTATDGLSDGLTAREVERGFTLHGFFIDSAGRQYTAHWRVPAGVLRTDFVERGNGVRPRVPAGGEPAES